MLDGLSFLAKRGFHRFVTQPRRSRRYAARTEPFIEKTREGLTFELDPGQEVDRHIAVDGIYERRFLHFIRDLLPEGAVMLDIGANIGNHALFLSRHCSVIHCFEPNPTAWQRLERNVSLNRADNIKVHRVGLGSENAVLPFRENVSGNLGCSGFASSTQQLEGRYRTIEAPIFNADEYISGLDLDRIDFIKIDVEGLETELFEALRDTIARHRPLLAFEHHGHFAKPGDYERILACLPDYAIAEACYAPGEMGLLGKAKWNLVHAGKPILRRVVTPEARSYDNLLAIPTEHGRMKEFSESPSSGHRVFDDQHVRG